MVEHAVYGLPPGFAKEIAYGRKTYNARSEMVATLPRFRNAWSKGHHCIIPAEAVFEPCYETGNSAVIETWSRSSCWIPIDHCC